MNTAASMSTLVSLQANHSHLSKYQYKYARQPNPNANGSIPIYDSKFCDRLIRRKREKEAQFVMALTSPRSEKGYRTTPDEKREMYSEPPVGIWDIRGRLQLSYWGRSRHGHD